MSISSSSLPSSPSLSSDDDDSSNRAGVAARVCTFKAIMRLEDTAGDPSDMGLSEQKLRPNPLIPRPIPGGAACLTGDPGTILRRAFSPSVTGDIRAGASKRAKSKGRMEVGASQKCGGVLGPAASVVMSGIELGWGVWRLTRLRTGQKGVEH